jgi:flagellar basal-body rod protein FlgF
MYKGIYIALSGAVLKQAQMDTISQNLANADTIGFKKDSLSFKDYLLPQDVVMSQPDGRVMSYISSFLTDFSAGGTIRTGNPMDIALDGNGFIALEGDLYTRRGDLKKDSEGYLTTYNGIKVMGNGGPISLPEGKVIIAEDGSVLVDDMVSVESILVDTIKIVDFENKANLKKAGEGAFTTTDIGVNSMTTVKQGYLEKSNVETIKEMVRMIETLREFETFQKAIHAFDEAAGKVINEIGRF